MTITRESANVPDHGYSLQAVLIARAMVRNPTFRAKLRTVIERLDKQTKYSNEAFDRTQQVAYVLTDIMREGAA